MKKLAGYISFTVLLLAASCKPGEFGDLNVNPTQVATATTKSLLTNSLQDLHGTVFGINSGILYSQYISEGPYPGASLYSTVNFDWAEYYYKPLNNLQTIINYNNEGASNADPGVNGSKTNQIAVARILKAYYFWWLTDRYGDLPYSDALKGAVNYSPKYDSQKDVYYQVFKELTEASAQLTTAESGPSGDILFNGDVTKWKKFANTTRLFAALRLIKNDFEKGKTEFNAAIADGILTSQSDNIFYKYIAGDPNNFNPWYVHYSINTRNDYAISSTLTDYLEPLADPRLPVYGEVLPGNKIVGLSYGLSTARNIPSIYSRVGDSFRKDNSPAAVYTYAQVLFVLAEGAKVGYLSGGDTKASEYYLEGIKQSFTQYGVFDTAKYSAYIANPAIAYSATKGLELIITQKWVHQYLNGYEAWTDWRRTGFPKLTPAPNGSIASIPRRQGYAVAEKSLNSKNYADAIARQGADNLTTRIWWDK
ncbi:SusD/RagB family nutrient-binding outer membrane lipoprotein [Larkinella sp.]|uniref:SusD/RagB family nutrient-binding outer membrane lipoprotein n=1 Tax=Larkinella sp. TaxID=2034517 RepID=UPI003BACC1C1